jgi:BirA family biotin operon repressor/biotin-[acetyl-CoA-carboxylase] ligase
MQLRHKLVEVLSDGLFHSGQALGDALGVSRMAVWKHIRYLRDSGIAMDSVKGKGYRLHAPIEMLDADRIVAGLPNRVRSRVNSIDVLQEVDSTNTWLRSKALTGAPTGTVCLAEVQHAGRGRRNRQWVSPYAANLYLSMLHRTNEGTAGLGGLSLAAGVAVIRSLAAMQIDGIGLKWPNDVMVKGKKLSGILIEVVGESSGPCAVIIGIGINVNMPGLSANAIDQPWTDLVSVCAGKTVSRNQLAAGLIDQVSSALTAFETRGPQSFLDDWKQYDLLAGKQVDLHLAGNVVSGKACGIDAAGALLIETARGLERFASGDVSVSLLT